MTKTIPMTDPLLRFTGRIGLEDPERPFFIYPCSSVALRFTGRTLRVALENLHSYYENRLGVIVNGVQSAVLLQPGEQVIDLSGLLTAGENEVLIFKRQDCCHAYRLQEIILSKDAVLLPLLPRPARRMEVYAELFDNQLNPLSEVVAEVVHDRSFCEVLLDDRKLVIFGNGAEKCSGILEWAECVSVAPSARGLCAEAERRLQAGETEDVAYFEPFYLKDFIVTASKKKLF